VEISAVRGEQGRVLYRVVNVEDISAQKQLEEQSARLARVIEQADESVMITDLQGSILYVNPSFEKISGFNSGEVIGQNPRILKSGYQHQVYYNNLWSTITSGETWRGMLTNRRKDGALFHEEATIFPIRDARGEVINYAAVKRDITDHIQHEIELEAIASLSAALRVAGTRDEMLPIILDQVLTLFKARGGMLAMVDQLPAQTPVREIDVEMTRGEFRHLNERNMGIIRDRSLRVINSAQPY
jgi:PAS domain S-box-containing protein